MKMTILHDDLDCSLLDVNYSLRIVDMWIDRAVTFAFYNQS